MKKVVKNMEREIYKSIDGTKILLVSPIANMEEANNYINKLKFRYDNLLIIGNGFDLNLGLQTTYKSFVESNIFKAMYDA